jgi:glucose-6-phosphate 1-dehydrogenase
MPEVIPLEPSIIVIFGISGDLSKRYLLPALFHLIKVGLLDSQTAIVGVTRQDLTGEQLLDGVDLHHGEDDQPGDQAAKQKLLSQLQITKLDLDDLEDYKALKHQLDEIETELGRCLNRLFYLSIPPKIFSSIVGLIGQSELNKSCPHGTGSSRLLIEKPFGYDLDSAQKLISDTSSVFGEEQLFRIDHYLAKETVQNILTFRFENPIFEALWNRKHIASIEIYASEQIGIMGRKVFYEPLGALRDFIQSHLIQLLAIVAIDQPEMMDSAHIHAEKQKLLDSLSSVDMIAESPQALRGQYQEYRTEVDNPESATETFAGIRTSINNDRWSGVPISIWTGKGLAEKRTEIVVTFKNGKLPANRLKFRISPNEGIEIELIAKKPGYSTELQTARMNFSYDESFDAHSHPNAYERVLVDAIRGDHTLFATSQEVLAAWRVVQPVLDKWVEQGDQALNIYPMGSQGKTIAKPILG